MPRINESSLPVLVVSFFFGSTAFSNGNVQKMWHWWERSDPTRLAAVPGLIGEPSPNESKKTTVSSESTDGGAKLPTSNCPRTLKDLVQMTGAAKEAQWGEHDGSDASSTSFPSLGRNFFEDDSDASSDSADEPLEEVAEVSDSKRQPKDTGNFFDTHQRPVAQSSDISQGASELGSKGDDVAEGVFNPSVGPDSDVLTPMVKISHEYDRLALNSQSAELATGWRLGDFSVLPEGGSHASPEQSPSSLESKTRRGRSQSPYPCILRLLLFLTIFYLLMP